MNSERTVQGEQWILPGAERSAVQLAKARGELLRAKRGQVAPGPLFAALTAPEADLFAR